MAFAKSRGVENDPAGLGKLIGKKPNQASNLLHGWSSFGEKVARDIEAAAGLPTLWLDSETGPLAELPPKVATIAAAMAALPEPQLDWLLELVQPALETAQRAAISLAPDSRSVGSNTEDRTPKQQRRTATE